MSRETKSVDIGGATYELTQMGALEGRRLSILFAQVCGRILPYVTKMSLDTEALRAIALALNDVEPEKLEPLWKAFAKYAVHKPTPNKSESLADDDFFDEHFAGNFFGMWHFFVESAKLNFAGFLAEAFGSLASDDAGSSK